MKRKINNKLVQNVLSVNYDVLHHGMIKYWPQLPGDVEHIRWDNDVYITTEAALTHKTNIRFQIISKHALK